MTSICPSMPAKPASGCAVAVAVAEHPADVGMVHLDELLAGAVPEGQPLDLDLRVVVGVGPPPSWVLGRMTSGKAFWWFSGSGRPVSSIPTQVAIRFSAPRRLQVRIVGREPVVLGAGANSTCSQSRFSTRPSWLDVLSPEGLEWLWKSALIQPSVFTERTDAWHVQPSPRRTSLASPPCLVRHRPA